MKTPISKVFLAGFFGLAVAGAAPLAPGEAKLAQALQGLSAGKPLKCLKLRNARSSIIDGTAVIFESSGALFVNRPLAGAESLSASNALLIKSLTGEICRGEGIRLFDNNSRVETGLIFLGEFVPYRRNPGRDYTPVVGGRGRYR
jgi:hypothetical protein